MGFTWSFRLVRNLGFGILVLIFLVSGLFSLSIIGKISQRTDSIMLKERPALNKISDEDVQTELHKSEKMLYVFLFLTAATAFLMILLTDLALTKPINILAEGTKRISEGDLDFRISEEYEDKFGQLAKAFNTMAGKLKKSQEDIKVYTKDLEKKVNERTAELESINGQLRGEIARREEMEKKIMAYQEQLLSLTCELSFTEQRERRRIADNLHDYLGQSLAISKIKLGMLEEDACRMGLIAPFNEIKEIIGQAIDYTRSLTFELCPPMLYELGFEAAIEWLAERFQEQHGIFCRLDNDRKFKPLSEDLRILIFHMVRELLINVVKHSEALNVNISIRRDNDFLRIDVEDDGVGFDPSQAREQAHKSNSGFGLFSIQERLNYIGGQFEIESQPGQGTKARIKVPLWSIPDQPE